MIVPMKKVSILVMDKDKEPAIQKIRDLGILHIGRRTVSSPDLQRAIDRRIQFEIAIGVLDSFPPLKKDRKKELPNFEGDLVSHVVALADRRKELLGYIYSHQRECEHFTKWGDFEPKDFKYLIENGVNAYLYELSLTSYKENVGDVPVIVLFNDKKNKMVRLIAFDEIPNANPWHIPERSLHEMEAKDKIRQEELAKVDAELHSLSRLKKQLKAETDSIHMDIDFETARACMALIDENTDAPDFALSWISGYIPTPDMESLKKTAIENSWALCAHDPDLEDTEVPTKLKNNRLVSFIYPLTDFLGITPGYREQDISSIFLIFFSLFFAMLFGDGGYGAIVIVAALLGIGLTSKKGAVPPFFNFLLLMGITAFCWGILTCSWFGIDIASLPKFLQNISIPLIANVSVDPGWISAYNETNFWIQAGLIKPNLALNPADAVNSNLMFLCFTIALIHLGIARIKKIIRYLRSPRALAALGELGRIGMIFGMYCVTLSLVAFKTGFEGVQMWQIYPIFIGFGLVFIFENYEGSILKSILTSCANFISVVLSITDVFSNVMSYIRLWAVGVAGASIAVTVNGYIDAMLGQWFLIIFALLTFVIGHGFNMTLNALAVLVHGVRLNTLEFSGNIGLGWSGFKYRPLVPKKNDVKK